MNFILSFLFDGSTEIEGRKNDRKSSNNKLRISMENDKKSMLNNITDENMSDRINQSKKMV